MTGQVNTSTMRANTALDTAPLVPPVSTGAEHTPPPEPAPKRRRRRSVKKKEEAPALPSTEQLAALGSLVYTAHLLGVSLEEHVENLRTSLAAYEAVFPASGS